MAKVTDGNSRILETLNDFFMTEQGTVTDSGIVNGRKFRIAHISHLDLDGYGATSLTNALICLGQSARYDMSATFYNIIPGKVVETLREVMESIDLYDVIIITDLAINANLVELINSHEQSHKVLVFDHHVTKITDLPDNIIVTKDSPYKIGSLTCATELYYNFIVSSGFSNLILRAEILDYPNVIFDGLYKTTDFNGDTIILDNENTGKVHSYRMKDCMAYFVECVRIYDTYEFWKLRNIADKDETYNLAPNLNVLFHLMERDEFYQYLYEYITTGDVYALLKDTTNFPWIEKFIEVEVLRTNKYVASATRRMVKTPFKFDIYRDGKIFSIDYNAAVVFAEKSSPLIANSIMDQHSDVDLCAVIANHQVSMYSDREHVDVSEICRIFGGGGHKEAAGFMIPFPNAASFNIDHFISIIKCAGAITE